MKRGIHFNECVACVSLIIGVVLKIFVLFMAIGFLHSTMINGFPLPLALTDLVGLPKSLVYKIFIPKDNKLLS